MDTPTQDQISHFCKALAYAMDSWDMIAFVESPEIAVAHLLLDGYENRGLAGAASRIHHLFEVATKANIVRTLEFLEIVDSCIGEADEEHKL